MATKFVGTPGVQPRYPRPIFSCNQAALRTLKSVSPSVRLSVTPFSQCSSRRIILEISGVITIDKSDVHAKDQGQRSKVKVTEVKTQFSRFRAVTPQCVSRSSVKFQGHTGQKKSPILTRIERFWTVTPVWIHWWLGNDAQSLKQHRRGALLFS